VSLKTVAREIALTGPMSVADYVTRCLHDPEQGGYYSTRPAHRAKAATSSPRR
jgi:NADH dehydrogenase [ubiquinone] 1 alpha subcomplex assembly factor 7